MSMSYGPSAEVPYTTSKLEPTRPLDSIMDRVGILAKQLESHANRLRMTNDRLQGNEPIPPEGSPGKNPSAPPGVIGQVDITLRLCELISEGIAAQITRLERI